MKFLLTFACLFSTAMVSAVCPDGKTYPVTLTFDDGPHQAFTPKVLDALDAEKVKGTFFVLGEHFAGGKQKASNKWKYDILDRMKRTGHYIGSHTYNHLNHSDHTNARIKENITKPTALLKDYLNPILRLPYGGGAFKSSNPQTQQKNDFIMRTVKEAGFRHVLWNIDTNDWDEKKRDKLLPTMLRDICRQKGGIILFHDIQKFTVDNLRTWIKAIKAEGHSIVGLEKFIPEVKMSLEEPCQLPQKSVPKTSKEIDEMEAFIQALDYMKD